MLEIFTLKQWLLIDTGAIIGLGIYGYKKLRRDNIDLGLMIKRLGPK